MKDRLIDNLLKVAKKHKVLTYPALAFVAIISFFSYFFSWSRGAGKRVIAIVMVMVMLVSQSYFLTSSATALVDDEEAALVQKELQEASDDEQNSTKLVDAESQKQSTEAVTEATTSVTTETVTEAATEVQEETMNENPGTAATEEAVTSEEDTQITETSDEDEAQEDSEEENIDSKLDTESSTVPWILYYIDDNGGKVIIDGGNNTDTVTSTEKVDGEFVYNLSSIVPSITSLNNNTTFTNDGCYEFLDEWYTDSLFVNKVTDFTKVKAKKNQLGNDSIYLYCKRKLVKYKVTLSERSDTNDNPIISYVVNGAEKQTDGTYRIPIGSDMEITGISRTGYQFIGADVSGGTISSSTDNSVTVTFSEDSATKQVALKWNAKEYTITYAKDEDGAVGKTQTVTYDGTEEFLDGEDFVAEKEGWKFKGWKIGTNGTEVSSVATVSDYQGELYNKDVVLYPVYTYDGFSISKTEIKYQYKVPSTETTLLQGCYAESNVNGSSNFEYQIISGQSELADIGITASKTSSGISVTTAGPTATTISDTGAGYIPLKISITDTTAPTDKQTQVFTVKVYVEKCKVTIVAPDSNTVKTYDGTETANLTSPLSTNVADVKVTFTGCHYNSPNVAEADKIILDGINYELPSGDSVNNYDLTINYVEGSISKRPVYLKTSAVFSGERAYVRAGEQNPTFKVEEYTKYNSDTIGLLSGDTIESLGVVFSTNRPEDLTVEGEYSITAETANNAN